MIGLITGLRARKLAGGWKKASWIIALLLFFFSTDALSQLVLNEMMPFNGTTLSDQFNEYPDWLEVYNSGTETEYLSNYWLSDDRIITKKWQLPSAALPADDYMVYFASGRDITTEISYWHTVADLADEWRYHLPVSNIGDSWKTTSAATSAWSIWKSGIGYSDDDDSTEISQTLSLYMQYSFDITDPSEVNNAALYMDYDDGFIAYLNGTEIARSSNMGEYGDVFNYDDPSLAGREAIMYNGNAPEYYNASGHVDQLQVGENVLTIEVHNVSLGSSDLSSIPFFLLGFNGVQDDFELGNKYVIVNNIYPHTNFKIASKGEAIYLSDDTGVIIDSISTHYVPQDYSLGRIISDPDVFGYFDIPTPGSENSGNYALEYVSDSVAFEVTGKEYDTDQTLQLAAPDGGDVIYYSTDGSEPTESSSVYTGSLEIDAVQVVRARVIREDQLPGPVTTKTFFTGRKPGLTRVSVSTTPDNLWDYNTGIYVLGPNASSSNPHYGANFWMDWEKPANIEIYGADGKEWLNQGAGMKIYGAWSRAHAQKSLSFFARSVYGDGSFSYPLFEKKDMKKYESFILRNGGNDFNASFIRDAVSAYLGDKMDLDHQGYNPSVLYLNGEYFGIMNMREKINEHFLAGNNNVAPDIVNILESTGGVVDGSNKTYSELMNFLRTKDLSNQENYEEVKTMMDVDNYIRYWLLQVYIDNRDWPGNNIKFWSTQAPGSKWRWILYDTDFGYSLYDNPGYSLNTLGFAFGLNDGNWANNSSATELIRLLADNEEFQHSLINQFADRMNTDLLPERVLAVIDSFKNHLVPEPPHHFEIWGGSSTGWVSQILEMRTYVKERPQYMTNHILEHFDIDGTEGITVAVSDLAAGKVRVNSIIPPMPFSGDYYLDIPIQLEAIPAPGYSFLRWEGVVESSSSLIDYNMQSGGDFTAVFADASGLPIDIVINEINYASAPDKNTEDWIELFNNSYVSVDISGWRFVDNSSGSVYFVPEGTIIPSQAYMVFSRDIPGFKRFFPEISPILGDLRFGLNSDSDGIALLDNFNNVMDQVIFGSVAPWPEEPNGTGATLELIHPKLDNSLAENWKASLDDVGTPLQENSQYISGIADPEDISGPDIQLYPTVFSDMTSLKLNTSVDEQVSISVISMAGQVVEILENALLSPGAYQYEWRPDAGVEPGMYFIRLRTNSSANTYKVIYQ